MARDPLAVLRRLRDAAVIEASRDLAAARAQELQETRQLEEYRQLIRQEQSTAAVGEVANFAAWRPHARQTENRLQADLQVQEASVRRLQQVLLSRRADVEVVAKAMQRQHAEAERAAAGKEQALMDEAAGRARRKDH